MQRSVRTLTVSITHSLAEKVIMVKFFAWFFGTASLFAFCTSGIGLCIFGIAVVGFVGNAIGQSYVATTIYIIAAMSASYLLPIVVAIYKKKLVWLIIIPVITTFVFAFPSSFVTNTGCKMGNQSAVWAMRAIPLMWLAEATIAPSDQKLSCGMI